MAKLITSPTSKGQVTIPSIIRKEFGIDTNTMLKFSYDRDQIIIKPVKIDEQNTLRQYSKNEIAEFIKEDKISQTDAEYFRKIIES